MKRLMFITAALCALAGCTAEVEESSEAEENPSASQQALGGVSMGCYIDTPALDPYSDGYCVRIGNKPSIASFKLFTPSAPDYVVWYNHPECNGVICNVPISPGQTITMGAYYVYQGTPTQGADAVAEYSY